jgi:tetratricopeptide (TPR) repeat protein
VEPTYWENYRRLGTLYYTVGRYDRAAEQYRREADLNPNKAASLNNLGAAHFMGGEFEAAILDWTQAYELDADARALSNLGAAQFFNGDFVAAAETYQRAHIMNPNNYTFPGNVGEAYFFAGDDRASGFYQRATELATQQLAINPDNYTALSSKACYHAALGQADQAMAAIQRAIELNGAEVYTWYDAARVYMRLHRREDAVAAIQHALDLGYSRYLVEADANFASIKELIGELE